MRILCDCRWIGEHGIGRFASQIIGSLDGVRCLPVKAKPLSIFDPLNVAISIARERPDLYFSPAFNPPLWSKAPFVFAIHDLIHLHVPEEKSWVKDIYYRFVVRPALHKAYRVITVSEFSKREIIEWSGVSSDRVCVVGNGVEPVYNPEGKIHTPGYSYFLNVGNHKPHKNLLRLIRSFARSKIPKEVRLVFTGEPDKLLRKQVGDLGLEGRVVFSGFVPEPELPAYYRGASALLFPSLYEGFGLPIIEAMACGTPVITSKITAMPEVAAEAAILVDPYDCEHIQRAVEEVYYDKGLRNYLRDKGFARARHFSWDGVVKRTKYILENALGS